MVFRCSPLFSFPVRFAPFGQDVEATAFRLSPLEYPQSQTRLPAKVPAPSPDLEKVYLDCWSYTGSRMRGVFFKNGDRPKHGVVTVRRDSLQ